MEQLTALTKRSPAALLAFALLATAAFSIAAPPLPHSRTSPRRREPPTNIPGALPNIHIVSPVADGQWTMPAGDYGNLRYSPLEPDQHHQRPEPARRHHVLAPASRTATRAARSSSATRCTSSRRSRTT